MNSEYQILAKQFSYTGAQIIPSNNPVNSQPIVQLSLSQRDQDKKKSYSLDIVNGTIGLPRDCGNLVAESNVSPCGGKRIAFVQYEKKRILEIYDRRTRALERVDVSSLHGPFYTDAVFGGSSWRSDGNVFVYTAQIVETEINGGSDPASYADFGEGYTGFVFLT
jgi:hypothetical protein